MTITDPEQLAKLDTERLRRLFLQYTSRMHRAARSPKYCYFSGFAAAAPQLLTALKEQVLTTYRLSTEHVSGEGEGCAGCGGGGTAGGGCCM